MDILDLLVLRFLKSTHIYMISNSDTHLRSYTNSAITGNSSLILPRRAPMSLSREPMSPHRAAISSHQMVSVSWCFTIYHNVLQVFHDLLLCFTMFSESHIDRHRRPRTPPADHLGGRDNAIEIGDNSAEIGDDAIGIVDITAKVIPC